MSTSSTQGTISVRVVLVLHDLFCLSCQIVYEIFLDFLRFLKSNLVSLLICVSVTKCQYA